jgi:hexosaminidase
MEVVVDLEKPETIKQVTVGSMENQGPSIYFPTAVIVSVSNDGKIFGEVGRMDRPFAQNAQTELKDFIIGFVEREARFVKVKAANLKKNPKGGGSWLFVDEILID